VRKISNSRSGVFATAIPAKSVVKIAIRIFMIYRYLILRKWSNFKLFFQSKNHSCGFGAGDLVGGGDESAAFLIEEVSFFGDFEKRGEPGVGGGVWKWLFGDFFGDFFVRGEEGDFQKFRS